MKLVQGILIGLAIGILFAPDSGAATRAKLAGKLSDLKDDSEDYLSDAAENIKGKASDIADKVKSKVQTVAGNIKPKTEDFQQNEVSN